MEVNASAGKFLGGPAEDINALHLILYIGKQGISFRKNVKYIIYNINNILKHIYNVI